MRVLLRIVAVIVITGVVVLLVARGQELWLVVGLVAGVVIAAVVGRRQRHLEDAQAPPGEFDDAFGQADAVYGEPYAGEPGEAFGPPPGEAFGPPRETFADYPDYADAPVEPRPEEPGWPWPEEPVEGQAGEFQAGESQAGRPEEQEFTPEPEDDPAPEDDPEPEDDPAPEDDPEPEDDRPREADAGPGTGTQPEAEPGAEPRRDDPA